MDVVITKLAAECPDVAFLRLEAESVSEVAEYFEISSVPAFVFLQSGKKVDSLSGANVPELVKRVKGYQAAPVKTVQAGGKAEASAPAVPLATRLEKLINQKPIMLFMKGSPEAPECGFSRTCVGILNDAGVKGYGHFNILADQEVRQGLKEYSNWPTYPQLYANGKLVGGLDILKELVEEDELIDALGGPEVCSGDITGRLKSLINKAPVMLFMKGDRDTPRCGFSRTIVGLLNDAKITYETFDILEDNDVRQGLKEYSNWPTYPQLYSKGTFVGGLDIVKELVEEDELADALA